MSGFDPNDANYLNNRWVWLPDQFRYMWVSLDGTPPPGPPPRQAPGTPASYGHFYGHAPEETPTEKLLAKLVDKIDKIESKKSDDGGGVNMILTAMKLANDAQIAAQATRAADEDRRWQREQAQKQDERAANDRIAVRQEKFLTDMLAHSKPKDGNASLLEQLEIQKKLKETFEKETEPNDTANERIAEKAAGAFEHLARFAGDFYKDRRDAKKTASGGGGGSPAPSDSDIDQTTLNWIKVLEHVAEHYKHRLAPDQALAGIEGVCKGMDVTVESVIAHLQKFSTIDELFAVLDLCPEPALKRLKPVADTFSTGDGRAWFNTLLEQVRSAGS